MGGLGTRSARLPRRAFLGARLPPDDQAFRRGGVIIAGVVPGGIAARLGLQAGDLIERLAGQPVESLDQLTRALQVAGARPAVEVAIQRAGARLSLTAPVVQAPRERLPGQRVGYRWLAVDGARLRTVATRPTAGNPRGSVLLVAGIACETIEAGSSMAAVAHGFAAAGFATLRVDRRGVGDSEGGPAGAVDYRTERADMRVAWSHLRRRFPGPHLLFGHSVGAIIAAELAAEVAPDRIVVAGSPALTWLDCVEDNVRRQRRARGMTPERVEAEVAELRDHVATRGLSGRSPRYHAQLDAVDLPATWRKVRAPALVLHGEYDWVVGAAQARQLAAMAGAPLIELPGLDHLLTGHPDDASSRRDYGQGQPSAEAVTAVCRWIGVQSTP